MDTKRWPAVTWFCCSTIFRMTVLFSRMLMSQRTKKSVFFSILMGSFPYVFKKGLGTSSNLYPTPMTIPFVFVSVIW